MAIEHERPDPKLAPYVSGYHRYTIRIDAGERITDVLFPGWANLRFSVQADPWQVRLGRRTFSPVPEAALFGPSSHAGYVEAGSGTLIGAGITPIGWARLFAEEASAFADRVVPLERLIGPNAERLAFELGGGAAPAAVFDAFFLARLEQAPAEPPEVAALLAALGDTRIDTVTALAERLGVPLRSVSRVSRSAFGFTPKRLLRRARFMRALLAALALGRGRWSEALGPAGYYDQSHLLKDCRLFLGCSLGAFAAYPKPLAELSIKLRDQALHPGAEIPPEMVGL
ncbi:MAG TPA: helix-turn-helix domain-containing protein [Allosphingosinicella sp.]